MSPETIQWLLVMASQAGPLPPRMRRAPGMLCSRLHNPFLGDHQLLSSVTVPFPSRAAPCPPCRAPCHLCVPCTGQSGRQGLGGCSTHVGLRLCPIQVGVQEHRDVAVAGLQRDGDSVVPILRRAGEQLGRGLGPGAGEHAWAPAPYAVHDGDVAGGLSQQQLHGLHSAVLAGAHQRSRALLVLQVHVSSAGEQGFHHLLPSVADGQHQRRLASLRDVRDAAGTVVPPARPPAAPVPAGALSTCLPRAGAPMPEG